MAGQRPRVDRLAILGLGVGVLGLAASVSPVAVPDALATTLYAFGGACIVIAALMSVRWHALRLPAAPPWSRKSRRAVKRALARDCLRLHRTLDELLGPNVDRTKRRERTRETHLVHEYQQELRSIVVTTLREVEQVTTVSSATWAATAGQSARQLRFLSSSLSALERDLRGRTPDRDAA